MERPGGGRMGAEAHRGRAVLRQYDGAARYRANARPAVRPLADSREDERPGTIDELASPTDMLFALHDVLAFQLVLCGLIEGRERTARIAVEDCLHVPEFFGRRLVALSPPLLPDVLEADGSKQVADIAQIAVRGMVAAELQSLRPQEPAQASR